MSVHEPSSVESIARLRALRLDDRTARRQRLLMRTMVGLSVALVVAGQALAWARGESAAVTDPVRALQAFPSGPSLMLLGLLVGIASPFARALLLARWFCGRGERAMVWVSMLLLVILLSGLLLRHG